MAAFVTAPAGFLLAVLWFDLMFDVQVRGDRPPDGAVISIATYYRRVTTEARPMNLLVALAMLLTVVAIVVQLVREPSWAAWLSLPLAVGPMALARVRTVPHAVRLGAEGGVAPEHRALARGILTDHVVCFASIGALLAVQLVAA